MNDLAAIHMHRTKLLFDKPVYLGMSILDINKTLMYDFHYGYIKEQYNEVQERYNDKAYNDKVTIY